MNESAALTGWSSVVGAARWEPMVTVSNPVWRVTAEDGREWVLKRLPEYPPGAGPVEEFRVLCYLLAAGLPVAVPIITDDGQIVRNADHLGTDPSRNHRTGSQAYTLVPLLANDPALVETPEFAYTIGAGIGRLERALADCPWRVVSYADDPAAQIAAEQFSQLPADLRALTRPFRDRLSAAIVDLPTQRTHGDCNVGNVLVHDGEVTGFLDFDHLPTGPRVRDLSRYLESRLHAHVDHGNPPAMAAVLPHYVAGFHQTYPLTARELAAVVPLMLTVAIGSADWCVHGWAPDPAAYQRNLRTVEWLTQHLDELTDAALLLV